MHTSAQGKTRSQASCSTSSFDGIDCHSLRDADEIVECGLEAVKNGKIGKLEFSSLLSEAKKNLPSSHTFWGAGLVTGDSHSLAFGKMTDFQFESVFQIPLRLPVYGDKAPLILLPESSQKPLAVYSVGSFQAPRVNKDYYFNWKNVGGDNHKAAQRISDEDKVSLPMNENCDAVEADRDIKWMRKQLNSAVVLPGNRWCVSKISVDFDIYVGSLEKRKVNFGGVQEEMFVMAQGWLKTGSTVRKIGQPGYQVFH